MGQPAPIVSLLALSLVAVAADGCPNSPANATTAVPLTAREVELKALREAPVAPSARVSCIPVGELLAASGFDSAGPLAAREIDLKALREAPVTTAARVVSCIPVSELLVASGFDPALLPDDYISGFTHSLALLPEVMVAEGKYQHDRARADMPGLGLRPEAMDAVLAKIDAMFTGAIEEVRRPDAILRAFDVYRDQQNAAHPVLPAASSFSPSR